MFFSPKFFLKRGHEEANALKLFLLRIITLLLLCNNIIKNFKKLKQNIISLWGGGSFTKMKYPEAYTHLTTQSKQVASTATQFHNHRF